MSDEKLREVVADVDAERIPACDPRAMARELLAARARIAELEREAKCRKCGAAVGHMATCEVIAVPEAHRWALHRAEAVTTAAREWQHSHSVLAEAWRMAGSEEHLTLTEAARAADEALVTSLRDYDEAFRNRS